MYGLSFCESFKLTLCLLCWRFTSAVSLACCWNGGHFSNDGIVRGIIVLLRCLTEREINFWIIQIDNMFTLLTLYQCSQSGLLKLIVSDDFWVTGWDCTGSYSVIKIAWVFELLSSWDCTGGHIVTDISRLYGGHFMTDRLLWSWSWLVRIYVRLLCE